MRGSQGHRADFVKLNILIRSQPMRRPEENRNMFSSVPLKNLDYRLQNSEWHLFSSRINICGTPYLLYTCFTETGSKEDNGRSSLCNKKLITNRVIIVC